MCISTGVRHGQMLKLLLLISIIVELEMLVGGASIHETKSEWQGRGVDFGSRGRGAGRQGGGRFWELSRGRGGRGGNLTAAWSSVLLWRLVPTI